MGTICVAGDRLEYLRYDDLLSLLLERTHHTAIIIMIVINIFLQIPPISLEVLDTGYSRGRHEQNFEPHPGEVGRSQWRSQINLVDIKKMFY